MNRAYRNPVLQQLHAAAGDRALSGLSEVVYQTGQTWPGNAASQPQFWFPDGGLLALEQKAQATHVEVALLGGASGVPLPGQEGMRLRALTDGRAHVLPAEVVLSISPDLFLRCQQVLVEQMARWAYCARHHGPAQGLADRLLWAHQGCPQEALGWSVRDLPGCHALSPDQMDRAVQALVRAGGARLQGSLLHLQDLRVLEAKACGCHSGPAMHAAGSTEAGTRASTGH